MTNPLHTSGSSSSRKPHTCSDQSCTCVQSLGPKDRRGLGLSKENRWKATPERTPKQISSISYYFLSVLSFTYKKYHMEEEQTTMLDAGCYRSRIGLHPDFHKEQWRPVCCNQLAYHETIKEKKIMNISNQSHLTKSLIINGNYSHWHDYQKITIDAWIYATHRNLQKILLFNRCCWIVCQNMLWVNTAT